MTSDIAIGRTLTDLAPGGVLEVVGWQRIGSSNDVQLVDAIRDEIGYRGVEAPVYSLRLRLTPAHSEAATRFDQAPLWQLMVDARYQAVDASGTVLVKQDSAHAMVDPRTAGELLYSLGVWPVPAEVTSVRLDLVSVAEEQSRTLTLDVRNGTAHLE